MLREKNCLPKEISITKGGRKKTGEKKEKARRWGNHFVLKRGG